MTNSGAKELLYHEAPRGKRQALYESVAAQIEVRTCVYDKRRTAASSSAHGWGDDGLVETFHNETVFPVLCSRSCPSTILPLVLMKGLLHSGIAGLAR